MIILTTSETETRKFILIIHYALEFTKAPIKLFAKLL